MDTRVKIVGAEAAEARLPAGARVVAGYFDPLLAEHAARLEQLREGAAALAVVILDPPQPILPGRARAELVAALRCVDLVVPGGPRAPRIDLSLVEEEGDRRRAFMVRVRRLQDGPMA